MRTVLAGVLAALVDLDVAVVAREARLAGAAVGLALLPARPPVLAGLRAARHRLLLARLAVPAARALALEPVADVLVVEIFKV